MALDYGAARALLEECFAEVEAEAPPAGGPEELETLFTTRTTSYKEALLGCVLVRILDPSRNIRLPYTELGDDAFSGRSIDEQVVNPFLQGRRIPCTTTGPYLSTFRRGVRLLPGLPGQGDRRAYDALMALLDRLEAGGPAEARAFLAQMLARFVRLRDAARIPIARVQRLSLDQFRRLLAELMALRSGGRAPMLMTVALLRTLARCHALPWTVEHQGINVADAASGAGGDVTVREGGVARLVCEVTTRTIDARRVDATFNNKIAVSGIRDYLFVHGDAPPTGDAREAARAYFGQGHDISFVHVVEWVIHMLAAIGAAGREGFVAEMTGLLEAEDLPAMLKVGWNTALAGVIRP